ncbi:GDP-L-galactose phosphorylase 1-like isoform X1 [Phoenix dactylifera]|uniref:GDP-L-galactose phosphorylase 1-like isoform X1 n=1 Tax=Phoenix dactylifera TaxID=42345 RepID=A0A8B7C9D3_PHODC|nr:GDP-L-galactose phosphorylase 1-like isoform X1 [Phoenix dactylifera]XP_008794438.2 GDP-L-galactose phosphorylase 1-like isoform X1 [Phoenix dactylifera]
MVSVTQIEGEYPFPKQNAGSEQSKCHKMPFAGITTHVYQLGSPAEGNGGLGGFSYTAEDRQSLLDALLLSQWEDHAWKGQLKYDVTSCEIKVIGGGKNFITQLNENWNSNFLTEFENNVLQPLESIRSSYMKTHKEDILFCIAHGEKESSEIIFSTVVPKDGILVLVNANPVEYGHVFLIPYKIHQLSLSLDKKMFGLITRIAVEVNNCSFRIFFDHSASTCSDQIYFQASYFVNPLPVEVLPTVPVYGDALTTGICICEVADYPLKTLVFMSNNLKALADMVAEICSTLHKHNAAFNLLISDCGTKTFLFPQAHKVLMGCHLSAWECGGYFVYGTKSDFDCVSEVEIIKSMASISLDNSSFQALKQLCCNIAKKLIFQDE